jgi:hypothetical protein
MKTLKILACLCIMLGFAVSTAQSQAVVIKDWGKTLNTPDGSYPAISSQIVVTTSGNVMVTSTYQLDLGNQLVPKKGVNKVPVTGGPYFWFDWTVGGEWGRSTFYDAEMIVTSDGKVKIVYHEKDIEFFLPPNN